MKTECPIATELTHPKPSFRSATDESSKRLRDSAPGEAGENEGSSSGAG